MRATVAYRAVLLAAGLIGAALLVQQLIPLLLAVVVTVIVSLPLASAATLAQRRGLPRVIGALVALVLALGVVGGLGYALLPSFTSQVKHFVDRLPSTVSGAERYVHGLTGVSTATLSRDVTHFAQGYTSHPQRLIGPLESLGLGLVGILASLIVVLIAAIYIASDPDPLLNAVLGLLPPPRRASARQVMVRIRRAWMGWMLAMGIDMLVLGGLLYLGLRLVGIGFALGFAVVSALMTVIPNYGSIISAVPPLLFGLAQSPGKALLVLAVYVIVNQIEGNVILPLVMARTVDLHPALVAIGVLVMAQLFGLIGVVIAIPLLSLTIILVQELWINPQEQAVRVLDPRVPSPEAH